MGSSARKRKTKKADFTKPKLKVGKARPKPTNYTDTSFKSKSIALPTQQSLHADAPSASSQLLAHISHLHSHSASQRSDHLSALTTSLTRGTPLPIPLSTLLETLNPLIHDRDNNVRSQLPKTYYALPRPDIGDEIEKILPWIRAGLLNLSTDVRSSSLDLLFWALNAAGEEVVGCAGGWIKTLKTLLQILGWHEYITPPPTSVNGIQSLDKGRQKDGWTSAKTGSLSLRPARGGAVLETKTLNTVALFLRQGLLPPSQANGEEESGNSGEEKSWPWQLRNVQAHMLPTRPNAFGYLNLFGPPRDEEGEMYADFEERERVWRRLGFADAITKGVEGLRREGGEVGRAAGGVRKVLREVEALGAEGH